MLEIPNPEYIEFDVAVKNNVGNIVKIRNITIYKDKYYPPDEGKIKERLASELGYEGMGAYLVYPHNPEISIGDEIAIDIEPLHTVSIAVFSSSVYSGKFKAGSEWIPVAAVGQETTQSNGDKISLSKEALEANLESWNGGHINVNHAEKGEIDGLKIEEAKFEDNLLYFKVDKKLAEFIQNTASSGRSIEINNMKVDDDGVVKSYAGVGLAVLYPPYTPACTTDMGCSSTNSSTPTQEQGTIKTIFSKLADKLKSQSFMDSMTDTSGTDPNLEKTMTEETDKLKFAKMEADKSRDEALKEVETLKFSLVEKDKIIEVGKTTLDGKDKLLKEQTDKLKFYADAEVAAAEKLKNDQWETLKSSIPPGKFHKPEDEAELKKEFVDDPASFAVKMASFEKVAPTGESGAEFTVGSEANISKELTDMGIPSITFTGGAE